MNRLLILLLALLPISGECKATDSAYEAKEKLFATIEKQFKKDTTATERAIQRVMDNLIEEMPKPLLIAVKGDYENAYEYGAILYKALATKYYLKLLSIVGAATSRQDYIKWHAAWKTYSELKYSVTHPPGLQTSSMDWGYSQMEAAKLHCVDIIDCINRWYNKDDQ